MTQLRFVSISLITFASITHLAAQTMATGDSRAVMRPSIPATCQTLSARFTQSQRSSPPAADDTGRIQSALEACANTGKAVVLQADGAGNAFITGQIQVVGEALVIASGVILYGADSYSDKHELVRVTGTNAGIYGPGAIDGRGDLPAISGKPRLVQTSNVMNFIAYNITLEQASHPNLYIEGGDGATVWSVTIRTPANRHNADGIDIDSITNVTVNNSSVEAGDDGIAVKTNSGAASNITVENSKFYGTHGISIGSQTFRGVTNVLFQNNYVYGVDLEGIPSTYANAINIKTDARCGGLVKQVTYKNTCVTQAKRLIIVNANYGACAGTPGTPQFEDIVIDGVYATSSVPGAYSTIAGYSPSNPAQVYAANVKLDSNTQLRDQNANVTLNNSNGWLPSGTDIATSSLKLTGGIPSCRF